MPDSSFVAFQKRQKSRKVLSALGGVFGVIVRYPRCPLVPRTSRVVSGPLQDRPSALAAFLKFKQAAPEEILTGKAWMDDLLNLYYQSLL